MIKFKVNFTTQQMQRLRALSSKTGLSIAELIRRALDEYLERQGEK